MSRLLALAMVAAAQEPPQRSANPTANDYLPRWLQLGMEIRGRAEANTALGYVAGNDDAYYLHRLRVNAKVEPQRWVRAVVQAQDAQALAYNVKPAPATVANTLDLRQGYVELGADRSRWAARIGRQELILGEERLVGAANWGNVGRVFDAARLTYRLSAGRLDWFAAALVPVVNGRFDRPSLQNGFYGFYPSFDKLIAGSVLEPYVFWKTNRRASGELGAAGDLDVYTYGVRATGKLPLSFDYNIEVAGQTGHAAQDRHRAWAGHWLLGYALPLKERAPRLIAEYNTASGDRDPRDGWRGTFDQLFPTNHNKYGTADRIGWRNIHDLAPGVEWRPNRNWKLNVDCHVFWLASRQDALYTEVGAVFVRNPHATSSRVGSEFDIQVFWQPADRLQLGFGYARLFPGPYLKQSTSGGAAAYPYLMWSYRL